MVAPPGLAEPLIVAVVLVRLVAELVETDGRTAGVVNVSTAPNDVP